MIMTQNNAGIISSRLGLCLKWVWELWLLWLFNLKVSGSLNDRPVCAALSPVLLNLGHQEPPPLPAEVLPVPGDELEWIEKEWKIGGRLREIEGEERGKKGHNMAQNSMSQPFVDSWGPAFEPGAAKLWIVCHSDDMTVIVSVGWTKVCLPVLELDLAARRLCVPVRLCQYKQWLGKKKNTLCL